jgi:hypothetical protein
MLMTTTTLFFFPEKLNQLFFLSRWRYYLFSPTLPFGEMNGGNGCFSSKPLPEHNRDATTVLVASPNFHHSPLFHCVKILKSRYLLIPTLISSKRDLRKLLSKNKRNGETGERIGGRSSSRRSRWKMEGVINHTTYARMCTGTPNRYHFTTWFLN